MGASPKPQPHRATDQNLVPEQVQGSFLTGFPQGLCTFIGSTIPERVSV
jgi:hypothetical protein